MKSKTTKRFTRNLLISLFQREMFPSLLLVIGSLHVILKTYKVYPYTKLHAYRVDLTYF